MKNLKKKNSISSISTSKTSSSSSSKDNKSDSKTTQNIWNLRQNELLKRYSKEQAQQEDTSTKDQEHNPIDWPSPINKNKNKKNLVSCSNSNLNLNKKINWKPFPTQINLKPIKFHNNNNSSSTPSKSNKTKNSKSSNKSNSNHLSHQSQFTDSTIETQTTSSFPFQSKDPSNHKITDHLPSKPGFIPRISPTIKPPTMELSAGPTNPYLHTTTTTTTTNTNNATTTSSYPIPQSNSSTTPMTPLQFYGPSIPILPNHPNQLQIPSSNHPSQDSIPYDLHVNAPQGNVWVNDPLVMSDGTTPVNSTSENFNRSAAMTLDATSLGSPPVQPSIPHSSPQNVPTCISSTLPIPSESLDQNPQDLNFEKLNLDSSNSHISPLIETNQATRDSNLQFRRTSNNTISNRSPRRFKDHVPNYNESLHISNRFPSQDQKFHSKSNPISPRNNQLGNSLSFSNGSTAITLPSRDHSHRKYSNPNSQTHSQKRFHSSGRLSNASINKNQNGSRHSNWKNNHNSSTSNLKNRSSNPNNNDRHLPTHHSSRASGTSLRSSEDYSSNWYPPSALDSHYPPNHLVYNKYPGISSDYPRPPAYHYPVPSFYPPPTYRTDSSPSNPDSTNPNIIPNSDSILNMSSGGTGPIGHHSNPPPRFHIPSSSPTTSPYGPTPLTNYSPSAPPDPLSTYPPHHDPYYGMQSYYPSQYYYPPPPPQQQQQQQPHQQTSTLPFSPNGPNEMGLNVLTPSSPGFYGENVNDSGDLSPSNPGFIQQDPTCYPNYPNYPSPITQLPYVLDSVRYYILGQCEYYFSVDNLVKDMFLRKCMDEAGWVSISMIGRFNRIRSLTDDIKLVSEVMKMSGELQVDDQRMMVRRRTDWEQWILSSNGTEQNVPSDRPTVSEGSDTGVHHQIPPINDQASSTVSEVNTGSTNKGTIDEDDTSATTLSKEVLVDSTKDSPNDSHPTISPTHENENESHLYPPQRSNVGQEESNDLGDDGLNPVENHIPNENIIIDGIVDSLVIVTPGVSKKNKTGSTSKSCLQPTISIGFNPNEIKIHKNRSHSSYKSNNNNCNNVGKYEKSITNSTSGRGSSTNSNTAASLSDHSSSNYASSNK